MNRAERSSLKQINLNKLWSDYRWPAIVLLGLVGVAVLIGVGSQRYEAWLNASQTEVLQAAVAEYSTGIGRELRRRFQAVRSALELERIAGQLRSAGPQGLRPELDRIAATRPEVLGIRFVAPGEMRVDPGGVPPLGYAALDMVRRAGEAGEQVPPEVLFFGSGQQHIAEIFRLPGSGGETPGYLLVGLNVGLVQEALTQAAAGKAGYVELQQAVPGAKVLVLARAGDSGLAAGVAALRRPLPGYAWRYVVWMPDTAGDTGQVVSYLWTGYGVVAALVLAAMALIAFQRRRKALATPVFDGAVARVAAGGAAAAAASAPAAPDDGSGGGFGPPPVPRVADVSPGIVVEEGVDESVFTEMRGQAAEAAGGAAAAGAGSPAEHPPPPPPPPPAAGPAPRAAGAADLPDPSVFRAYDVRGVVNERFSAEHVRAIGRAIGSEAYDRGQQTIVVARDGRLSSPDFHQALVTGLQGTGRDVVDIGVVPTPVLYFATYFLNTGSGVMITGSHNPQQYNGLKIMLGGDTLFGDDIGALRARLESGNLQSGEGNLQEMDLLSEYIRRISEDIPVALGNAFRIVVDCGNGVAGAVAPKLYRALGHDVVELYCDLDGRFPNHEPDTSAPENLQDLAAAVTENGADIGFGFDGDGDRLAVVDGKGNIIWPDRLMMLFARDILSRNPGATVVYDVKCTSRLGIVISKLGGTPVMWKTGHSYMKRKLKEESAALAGEMSGHIFFQERWYGFDDAMYAGARLLEILMALKRDPTEVLAKLPTGLSTPELRVDLPEGQHLDFMSRFLEAVDLPDAEITTIDGIRADFADGWGLVRASNTAPSLVFRFEAHDEAALARIQSQFRAQLLSVDADLSLPF